MIEVVLAIVAHENKILIAQRKKGKNQELLWEFPGGKLEKNESMPECLMREFQEELEKDITVHDFFMDYTFTYPDIGTIHLNAYFASCADKNIPAIYEHEQVKWISIDEIDDFNFCPADLPFIEKLKTLNW